MTSITSALAGQYYQLSGNSSNANTSTGTSNGLSGLLNALNGMSESSNNVATTGNAYALNLSDSAKAYLAGLQNGGNSSGNSSSGTNSFLLSPKQREALEAIMAKYKDKPITQENYDALQADLETAGLAPKQLAMRDQLRNLNPTAMFLDALNGVDTSNQPKFGEMTDAQKTQGNNYMQNIVKQWQLTAPADTEAAAATDATTA